MKKRIGIIGLGLTIACLMGSGCASVKSSLDNIGGAAALVDYSIEELDKAYQKWLVQYEAAGGTIGNDAAEVEEAGTGESATASDEVDYSQMVWCYGGFNGASATFTEGQAQIKNLVVTEATANGDASYQWVKNMSAWGFSDSDICAIVAVFFKCDDGVWRGGKFDHISTSRTSRELEHCASYSNWTMAGVSKNAPVAFVIVQYDGKRRTNILVTGE